MYNSPLKLVFYSFILQPAPLTGASRRVRRLQAGLGLGLGAGAELGRGQGVLGRLPDYSSEGFLTTLCRSHCSKTFIFATAPQPTP